MPGRLWGENFNVKHEKMQVILYIYSGKVVKHNGNLSNFCGPQEHIMEAPVSPLLGFYSIRSYSVRVQPLNGHPSKC